MENYTRAQLKVTIYLGSHNMTKANLTSALQSVQRAIDISVILFGEEHSNTADSYHLLGVTQPGQGDFSLALHPKQLALDISLKLFGEEHCNTGESYHSLGI